MREAARAPLERIAQFLFRRESRDLRVDLQNNLVESAIFSLQRASVSKIKEYIEKTLKISNFPDQILESALKRLLDGGRILEEQEEYYLSPDRFNHLKTIVEERKKYLDMLEKQVVSYLHKHCHLSGAKCETALKILYEFLVAVFSQDGKYAARVLVGRPVETPPLSIRSFFEDFIKRGRIDSSVANALKKYFGEFHAELTPLLKEICQTYVHIELVNLDPECNFLERTSLSMLTLLLDTNVLFSIVLDAHANHGTALEICKLTKYGVKLVFTGRTKEEYLRTLDDWYSSCKNLGGIRPSLLSKTNNDFLRSFQQGNFAGNLEGYYFTLRQLEILLSKYNICPFQHEEIKFDDELFKKVISWVEDYADLISRNPKNLAVAEHDAFHLLLVRKLRGEVREGIFGPNYWFLSFDISLPHVDKTINQYLKTNEPPSSIHPRIFLELITPFLGPEAGDKLSEILTSFIHSDFIAVGEEIDVKILSEVAGPWLDFNILSDEDIIRILGQKFVKEALDEISKSEPIQAELKRQQLRARLQVDAVNEATKKQREKEGILRKTQIMAQVICSITGVLMMLQSLVKVTSPLISFFMGIVLLCIGLGLPFRIGPLEVRQPSHTIRKETAEVFD